MTPNQLTALKADIQTNFASQWAAGEYNIIAAAYNSFAAPDFIVWKSNVSLSDIGTAFVATALAAMTSGNNDRLVSFALYNPNGVQPSRSDHRAFFDDVFSPASGQSTREALLALWKRKATRAEKLFATGVGTDVSPATLVYEGHVSGQLVIEAMNNG